MRIKIAILAGSMSLLGAVVGRLAAAEGEAGAVAAMAGQAAVRTSTFDSDPCDMPRYHGVFAPARGPPTAWGELVQAHDDREAVQVSSDDLPVIDIHSL
ncbi:MAG: hypothetical protein ACKOEX_02660 [Planctomycetia bacterium]